MHVSDNRVSLASTLSTFFLVYYGSPCRRSWSKSEHNEITIGNSYTSNASRDYMAPKFDHNRNKGKRSKLDLLDLHCTRWICFRWGGGFSVQCACVRCSTHVGYAYSMFTVQYTCAR